MKLILLMVTWLMFSTSGWGQWTEPDSTWCPQPGPGAQAPWISNDNLRLYISSPADLAMFERPHPDSAWGPMQMLPPHINSTATQRSPAESPTGDTLYFIGDPRSDCPSYGSYDIYFTVRTDTGWGPAQNPGLNVNSNHREFSVGISRDGSILLVAAARNGTFEAQLFWCALQEDGTWGEAIDFGPAINNPTFDGKEHPTLSPDNNRLLFCHRSVMLGDIWESHKVDGVWQQAVPLPTPVNNWPGPDVTREEDPCLALDGRTLWFRKTWTQFYDYQIMVSIDTSVLSVPDYQSAAPTGEPSLSVSADSFGSLQLCVSGMVFQGLNEVQVHDILGRLVTTQVTFFARNNVNSSATVTVSDLPSGTYVISIPTLKGTLSAKFITIN